MSTSAFTEMSVADGLKGGTNGRGKVFPSASAMKGVRSVLTVKRSRSVKNGRYSQKLTKCMYLVV